MNPVSVEHVQAGGRITPEQYNFDIQCLKGDLKALKILKAKSMLPLAEWAEPSTAVQAKKRLWNARTLLVQRLSKWLGSRPQMLGFVIQELERRDHDCL